MKVSSLQSRPYPTAHRQREPPIDSLAVLDALNDAVCRRILSACEETPRTAQECAAACDVPLSTVYRKLDVLTDAALLVEGVRVDADYNFPREFSTRFDTLSVSLDGSDGGTVEVRAVAADGGAEEREVTR